MSEIESGKREVSCGYEVDYEPIGDGKYQQVNIRGNHVAVVENGRAGSRVAIKDALIKDEKLIGHQKPNERNAYLYNLTGEKQAISVTIRNFSHGLSGKLISGDIVSVIAPDFKKQGTTVIPAELKYVEVNCRHRKQRVRHRYRTAGG